MDCGRCGRSLAEGAEFCSACGQSRSAVVIAPGLPENAAGALCYAMGWLTGLVMLLIDRRPFVRQHAAQSVALFGGLSLLKAVLVFLGVFPGGSLGWGLGGFFILAGLISSFVTLAMIVFWLACMVKAYRGERFRVPVAADLADRLVASSL